MASSLELAFVYVFLLSLFYTGSAAPLRMRRSTEAGASASNPLTLKPQQESYSFDLEPMLNFPSSTLTSLDTVPASCAMYNAAQGGECPTFFVVSNVTYDDCGDAFTICRCSTANMTTDTAVERLGRVPVGLRRYVASVLLLPTETTHAYTLTSGDIHMFGDTQMNTWVHEAIHAYDFASGSPFSGSQEWLKATESDTCVPDTYSTNSASEDFAQMGVMKIYSMIHNNSLPEDYTTDCMSHQLDYMNSLALFNNDSLFGNTCAIEGSDPGARHVTPPPVLNNTRVFPVPPSPSAPLETSTAVPVNNAAMSMLFRNSYMATLSGVLLACWFL